MNYVSDGMPIKIGDRVLVEAGSPGLVVCDFDNLECLDEYKHFLPKRVLAGGGELSSGVMIRTEQFGLIHYAEEDDSIVLVERAE
jgi:hypothetical protein